ncbi:ABC-three component system protein [Chryseobacterium sp.]|uniref:ABC-three component system protein n=1 Tax=Chryseobacterium sp. TaxID=1871047 RepID=UPI00333FF874
MTQLIDPSDIHSAADIWNGFIYQGKVALFHVLKLISEKDNIENLHVQLDSLEDFAIVRYDENDNIIPISLHQVKALKCNLYSTYDKAFTKLEQRKAQYPCEDNAYFHLANQNEKDLTEIETLHPNLKLYIYSGNPYCNIKDIQSLILAEVKSCLIKLNKSEFIGNHDYIFYLSCVLEEIITSQILAIHACNHSRDGLLINEGAYHFTIPLNNFKDKIACNFEDLLFDKVFYFKRLRLDINTYYQEFCLEFEDDLVEIQKEKLSDYLIYINSLTETEFENLIQKITPHKEIKYSDLDEYKRYTVNDDDFKIAFLYTLCEIRDSNLTDSKVGWKDGEKKVYYPSTINEPDAEINKKKLCRNIIETASSKLIEVPFNSDFLITSHCQVDSIEETAGKIINISSGDLHNKITTWKNVALINREQAKLKLNDNDN